MKHQIEKENNKKEMNANQRKEKRISFSALHNVTLRNWVTRTI